MNAKKINWMFIAVFVCYLAVSYGLALYSGANGGISIYPLYLINELIYIVPAFLFVFCSGSRLSELLPARKIKISTALMTVLFTFLCLPLTTVVNVFTMFFVENTVAQSSGTLLRMPFGAAFFLIAVYAPVCEEIIFRGITYESLRRDMNPFQTMCLSAVFFGLAHMNFNQAAYALLLGAILVLLREATGSLLSTMLFHVVFNGYNVVLLYMERWLRGNTGEALALSPGEYTEFLLRSISIFAVLAAASTALAGCVLAWIAGNENRKDQLRSIWRDRRKGRGRVFRIPLLLVFVLYVGMMVLDVVWL